MLLFDNGTCKNAIIVGKDASEILSFAAEELQKYIKKISGITLPIKSDEEGINENRVLIGGPDVNRQVKELKELNLGKALESEGFVIKTLKNDLVLAGSDDRNTLYAVYHFIERVLGVKWINPLEEEIIPKIKTFETGNIDLSEKPSLKHRGLIPLIEIGKLDTFKRVIDWMAKNKLNKLLLFIGQWYAGKITVNCPWDWVRDELTPEVRKRGIVLDVGHHAYDFYLPPEKYFDDHPEYFALVNGKRIREGQICFSNPQAVATFRDSVIQFVKTHPEVEIFSLFPNDRGGFCECEGCRPRPEVMNLSDIILRFTNAVAKAVYKINPKVKIGFPAYSYCLPTAYLLPFFPPIEPPINVKPFKNVVLYFALHSRDYSKSLDEQPGTLPYRTLPQPAGEILKQWVRLFKEGGNEVYIYEYYGDEWQYKCLILPILHTISGDISFLTDLGVEGIHVNVISSVEGVDALVYPPDYWFPFELNLYAFSKMAWNKGESPESVVERYYEALYGKSKDLMINFYKNMAETMIRTQRYIYFSSIHLSTPHNLEWYDEQIVEGKEILEGLKRCRTTFEEAEKLERDKTTLKRIAMTESNLTYAEYCVNSVLYQLHAKRYLVSRSGNYLEEAEKNLTEAVKAMTACTRFASKEAEKFEGLYWMDALSTWTEHIKSALESEIKWIKQLLSE